MTSRHQIPNNWEWVQIGSVAKTSSGGTPSRKNPENYGGKIPWVKSGELGDGRVLSSEETISELGLNSSSAKVFPKGTLCIALYGATVGKLGVLEIDAATNQAVCGIFLPDEIDRDFTYYFLLSLRPRLIELGKGGAQPNISQEIVRSIWLPKPSLSVQREIVAKLDELLSDLDAGVANLKRTQVNLRRYRAAILKAATEGRLTEEWRRHNMPTEAGEQLLARILVERRAKWEADQLSKFARQGKTPTKGWQSKYVDPTGPDLSNLPELPEVWCWATLEQMTNETANGFGKRQQANGEPSIVLRLADITNGKIDLINTRKVNASEDEIEKYRLNQSDLLAIRVNGSPELVGRFVHVSGFETPVLYCDHFIRIRLVAPEMASWLRYYADTERFRKHVERTKVSSAGQNTISQGTLLPFAIPLPPQDELKEIVSQIEDALSVIDATEKEITHQLAKAASLRQSILTSAFNGKLSGESSSNQTTDEAAA